MMIFQRFLCRAMKNLMIKHSPTEHLTRDYLIMCEEHKKSRELPN